MKLTAKLAKKMYDFNKDSETHLLVELEAPKVELTEERSPICVIPILDISGSMAGDKLDYLQKACRKLIDHLAPGDYMGVVAYDSAVYEVAPVREVTQEQKENLKKDISKLRSGSATNMSGGLLKALEWINKMDLPDGTVLRVILFTDGHANVGIRGRDLIGVVSEQKDRATVSAFGFGNDCNQELLADIAARGDGNYAFIDSADAALTAFGRELGGLMTTYAQNIKIHISPDKNNEIVEILNDEDVVEDGKAAIVGLRDILGEEKKWVVAKIKLSKVEKPLPRKVNALQIVVEYMDKDGKSQKLSKYAVKVNLCKAGEESSEEDSDVVKHRDRLLASKAQEQAEIYARTGDFAAARLALSNCSGSIADSNVKSLLGNLSANYSVASYSGTRGLSNSVRSRLKGKRVSYTSGEADSLYCDIGVQTLEAMNVVADSFTNDKTDISTVTTTTGSEKPTDNSKTVTRVTIGHPTKTGSVDITDEEEKSTAVKKRTKMDW